MRRLTTLTTALGLLVLAAPAGADVIIGRIAEPVRITRALVGTDSFVTTSDGQKVRLDGETASVLVAWQLVAPQTLVVIPDARPAGTTGAPMALVLATATPRTAEPAWVIVLGPNATLLAGVSTNVFTAETTAAGAVRPGAAIVVTGGPPIVAAPAAVSERTITLRGGQSVVIADGLGRTTTLTGEVDFDPAALRAGEYVTVVQREGGRYYLSRATPPRTAVVPGGTVAHIDEGTQVITLSDGRRIDARAGGTTILRVAEQPAQVATLRTGTIVVIDPGSALAVDAPSALPADVVMSGRIVAVPERTR